MIFVPDELADLTWDALDSSSLQLMCGMGGMSGGMTKQTNVDDVCPGICIGSMPKAMSMWEYFHKVRVSMVCWIVAAYFSI